MSVEDVWAGWWQLLIKEDHEAQAVEMFFGLTESRQAELLGWLAARSRPGGGMSKDKRERLAALEHDQWAHWTRYMLEVLQPLVCLGRGVMHEAEAYGFLDSEAIKAVEAIKRWHRQIETPYADLTEREKDSDRTWADKVLAELDKAAG